MTPKKRRLAAHTLPICVTVLLAGTWVASAGDLNPPVGPILPTMKTLVEVEPRIAINAINAPGDGDSLFRISQPGSYYLTGNITGEVGKHGIEIAASGVTLDLNGFDLLGVTGMGAFDGVSTSVAALTNITVINGSIRDWGDEGIDLWTLLAVNCRVEGVLASGNIGYGIAAGANSTITHCVATDNGTYGIFAYVGSNVAHCSAYLNATRGIFASNGGMILHCAAYLNGEIGILTSAGSTISDCSSYSNGDDGFSINNNSTISNCTASLNSGNGIAAAAGCTVSGCTVRQNTLDGIFATSACVIRGNACSSNALAGIHTSIGDNRIEDNNCIGPAERGIDVDAAGNTIIKNSCAGNTTDWAIAANNVYGPIIDRRAPASAAVNGFSAVSSLGSTDANANFSY